MNAMIWQKLLAVLVAISGFPIGLFIASLCKEELKAGLKWFKLIMIGCAIISFFALIFLHGETLLFLLLAMIFMFLLALAALIAEKCFT